MGQYISDTHKSYEYFAFISYSRKDEKWAKRLQQELEKYRLPMALYKEVESLPKNIRPVFRDVTDLSAGQLQSELQRQLDDSQKLIVICSPHSAKSEWVNKEIRHFIDRRGYADVIPLVVDGTPNGGDTECFPESLRLPDEEELLGISVKELGWRNAFLRVVSGLLSVKYDSLKRRHEQRRKRNRMIAAAALLLFMISSAFIGYVAWDYYIPHSAFYADYVLRRGVPQGIGPLHEQELSGRSEHYVIVTERRRVVSLTHANSSGRPIPHAHTERLNRPMIARYFYGDDGNIRMVEYMDKNGNVLLAEYYTPDLKAMDFIVSGNNSVFQTLASSTMSMSTGMLGLNTIRPNATDMKSDITRHGLTYDENGFVTKIIYMRDNRQTPVLDAEGIGGLEYKLDGFGRPVEVRYLGLGGDGNAVSKNNVAGKRYTYDGAGNLIREEYIDPAGKPTLNEQGWMISENEYDAHGNVLTQRCYDENGNLLPNNEGYAAVEWEFDRRGNMIRESYFSADGEPIASHNGFASVRAEYDERGRCNLLAAYGPDGRPASMIYGHSSIKMEYDQRDNLIRESYFDADGRPIILGDGYSSVEIAYDDQGRVIRAAYWEDDGQPALIGEGYSAFEQAYDDRGNLIQSSCFGADGQPVVNSHGFSSARMDYDDRGNLIKESYFGVDSLPVLAYEGLAGIEMDYDDRGNQTKIIFLGTDGHPLITGDGCAGFVWEYDNRGNMIREYSVGINGEPVLNSYGYCRAVMEYDELGNLIRETYFDTDGQPVSSD